MTNLILVDTSYTAYYRFNATLKWYKLKYPDEIHDKNYDWSTNAIFMNTLSKMFIESIYKLIGKKICNESKIIFCMDSPNVWRFKYYNNYKSDRVSLDDKFNYKPTFDSIFNIIIPDIIKKYKNISSIRINEMEADDIIAVITKNNPNVRILIISADNDFKQLGDDNITFYDYKKKIIKLTKEEAIKSLKNKIILGDKSDNIVSIFNSKKMTKKFRDELINDNDKLQSYINKNDEVLQQYKLNQMLIDFNFIPNDLQKKVLNAFNNI